MQTLVHLVQDLARHVQDRIVEQPVHIVAQVQIVVEVEVAVQVEHQQKMTAQALVLIPNKFIPKSKLKTFRRFCLQI